MRQRGYQYRMFTLSFFEEKQSVFAPILAAWRELFEKQEIADWEFVGGYLSLFLFFKEGRIKWKKATNSSWALKYQDHADRLFEAFLRGMSEINLQSHCQQSTGQRSAGHQKRVEDFRHALSWMYQDRPQLWGVPERALSGFARWREGDIPLNLLFYVPSGEELLALQVKGQRCVTCLVGADELVRYVEEGRDVWSFCLHDLMHASHFFAEGRQFNIQRYLSYFFLKLMEDADFQRDLQADLQWRDDFLYIATDMNAHPVHVCLSFHAKRLEFFKRGFQRVDEKFALSSWGQDWSKSWEDFVKKLAELPLFFEAKEVQTFKKLAGSESGDQELYKEVEESFCSLSDRWLA